MLHFIITFISYCQNKLIVQKYYHCYKRVHVYYYNLLA